MSELSPQSRRIALTVAAAFFMQMLDGVIIVTAIPEMARAFGVNTLAMSVGVTSYLLSAAVFVPSAAWLSDRFGARRIFLIAIAIFTAASLGCGLATTLHQFVAARVLQGAGGALMVPVGRIIVLRSAAKSEIIHVLGLIVWPALFAPVVGPALGGFLTTYATWQWNFWVNLPLGLVGLALVARIVPTDEAARATPFDWIGFLLSGTTLASLLVGFETLANGTLPFAAALLLVVLGIGLAIATIAWLRSAATPLLDLGAVSVPTFFVSEIIGGLTFRLTINAVPFLLPLLFQIVFGLDPFRAGGLVVSYFVGNLAMKTGTTQILRRFGFRSTLATNGLLSTLAMAGCAALGTDTSYAVIIAVLVAAGLTRSMQFTALAILSFADIDAARRGSASTLSTMFQQITIVTSVALATVLLNVSQQVRGETVLTMTDFRVTFCVMAVLGLLGSLGMLVLRPEAGREVSGHRTA